MAITHQPIFTQTPQLATARWSTSANTNRDGSGTIVTIMTAGTNGSKVFTITAVSSQASASVGANSAMIVRFWYSTDGGTTWFLLPQGEVALTAVTASNTVAGASAYVSWDNLVLPASAKIGFSISVHASAADNIDTTVQYQDY